MVPAVAPSHVVHFSSLRQLLLSAQETNCPLYLYLWDNDANPAQDDSEEDGVGTHFPRNLRLRAIYNEVDWEANIQYYYVPIKAPSHWNKGLTLLRAPGNKGIGFDYQLLLFLTSMTHLTLCLVKYLTNPDPPALYSEKATKQAENWIEDRIGKHPRYMANLRAGFAPLSRLIDVQVKEHESGIRVVDSKDILPNDSDEEDSDSEFSSTRPILFAS
jgi:hypothetical protein